jgi:hypothetical protein
MRHATEFKQLDENLFKFRPNGSILGGSSVGHVGIYLAIIMGCDPISILGMDLSYPSDKSHATGSVNTKNVKKINTFTTKDIMGREIRTNMPMYSYAKVVEKMIPRLQLETGIDFFNCTQGADGNPSGIIHKGPCPRKLEEVIREYCVEKYPIRDTIKQLITNN